MLARPGLPSFDYVRANTLDEVVHLKQTHGEALQLLMGGTDLLVRMRDGAIRPQQVLDLKHLPGICDISFDPQSGLTLGAALTMNQVVRHPAVQTHYPLLAEAANSVASYQLRNRATVGGNLCNASPCADAAPALLALQATVELYGPDGARQTPLEDFFVGPGQTIMQPSEFMTAIHVPAPPSAAWGRYLKLGRNQLGDLALVGVATCGFADEAAPSGYRFRIALGAVAPTPLRALAAEEVLSTHPLSKATLALAAEKAKQAAQPIDDVRASAAYRLAMVQNLTLRGLRDVHQRIQGGQ